MHSVATDVKYGLRALTKSPGIVVVALLTIALGVGVNTAMFSVVNGVILAPSPFAESERMVSVWPEKRHSEQMILDMMERLESFEVLSGYTGGQFTMLGEGEPEVVRVAIVGAGHFEVTKWTPILGRLFLPGDAVAADGQVAILAHDFWARRFGSDPSIIGRVIELGGNGVDRRTVVGVMPPNIPSFSGSTAAWVPMIMDPEVDGFMGSYGSSVIARLKPGVAVEVAAGH